MTPYKKFCILRDQRRAGEEAPEFTELEAFEAAIAEPLKAQQDAAAKLQRISAAVTGSINTPFDVVLNCINLLVEGDSDQYCQAFLAGRSSLAALAAPPPPPARRIRNGYETDESKAATKAWHNMLPKKLSFAAQTAAPQPDGIEMLKKNEPLFTYESRSDGRKICLPTHLDRTNLIEITMISDLWVVYLDTVTGQRHDSAVYYAQAVTAVQAP